MSFKVLYRNLEVVCDTIQDVDVLADWQEQRDSSKIGGAETKPATIEMTKPPVSEEIPKTNKASENHSINDTVSEQSIAAFIGDLNDKTLLILKALADAPNGLSDEGLRTATKIDSKLVLAGTMSSIAKTANKHKIAYESVVSKEITDNRHGKRKYHYTLKENIKDGVLKNIPSGLF